MTTATLTLPADKFDATLNFVRPTDPPKRAPLDKLAVLPGFNTRVKDDEYNARVEGIKESIIQHGFYEDKPLSVTMLPGDDTIYIYDGEHRFDGARAASLDGADLGEGLPISFAKEGATVRDLTIHLVHGNAGANLNPVEFAAVVRRLKNLGLSKEEIAKEVGKTTRHIDNLLVLAGTSQTIKRAVAGGQIAAAEVVKLVRKDPKVAAEKVADAVKAAEERGKKKATPKTMAAQAAERGPIMKTVRFEHAVDPGTVMGELLKAIAKQIRGEVKFDGNDKVMEGFTVNVALGVVDQEAMDARAARAAEREAAAKKREEERAARAAEREKAAVEKAAKKKAADDAKAEAAKAAAAAKTAKANATKKVVATKTQSVQKPSKANGGVGGAPAKAAAGKTSSGAKTSEAPEKPAKAASKPKATKTAPKAESKPDAAPAATDDGMGGL